MNAPTKLLSLTCLALCLCFCLGASLGCSSSDDDDGDPPPATGTPDAVQIDLAGTSWQILSVTRGSTSLRASDTGRQLRIDFNRDGTLSGSSGCNNFVGNYTQDRDRISINSSPSTLRGCDAEVLLLENAVISSLSVDGTISRVDDSIAVLNSGEGSVQLQRR